MSYAIFAAAVLSTLALLAVSYWGHELDCKTASRTVQDGTTVEICRREYERTSNPLIGAYLSDALRRANRLEDAAAIANGLLTTSARADALQTLGKIASEQKRTDDAERLYQEARQLHRAQGDHVELARDDQALALIQETRNDFVGALQTLDEAISEARTGGDALTETYCHLTAARVLMHAGYFEAAHQELDRAGELATSERELAYVWFGRGNLQQEVLRGVRRTAHNKEAVTAFERSLEIAQRLQLTSLVLSLHLNLAYSLAEVEKTDEADRHLKEAGLLDHRGKYENQRRQLAARIAYRRGNFTLASSLNEQAYSKIDDSDEQIEVCVMQARIALATGDLAAAANWAQRGVDSAEKVRREQTMNELRPWVLSSRRRPFEVLFTALLRAGRFDDAVVIFDQWQGRTLLDQMGRPSVEPSIELSTTATRVQSLERWLPFVSKTPLMTNDERAVMKTLRTIDLVAFAAAAGEREQPALWRLTVSRGRIRFDNLGSIDALRDRLDLFTSSPTEPAIARELGALLLPDEVVHTTKDPLFVVLDAPLAGLPFVALRRGDQPIVALRPVIRAPRLPGTSSCETRSPSGNALVLADAAGDLPDARRESSRVASLFGTTPLVGAAATSTALFAAKSDPLLHIAVHAEIDAGGGVLKLYDRAVSAAEISANKLGPQLVVLSACSTARSQDPELAGSLSTAFLAAGSSRVVATLRAITDVGALEFTSRFYENRGADDPVRTLAKIQAELAQTANKDWPSFAVFGKDVCLSSPPANNAGAPAQPRNRLERGNITSPLQPG